MNPSLSPILLILALAMPLTAEDFGSMPYAKLYALFQDAAGVTAPNIRPTVTFTSVNKDVKPSAITLTIRARSGPIKIDLGPDAEILNFPLNPELLKENPAVFSNQPKGTLRLVAELTIQLPDGLSYRCAQLNALLEQANAQMKKQAGTMAHLAPQGTGLKFQFRSPYTQTVTIAGGSGSKTLRPDGEGTVIFTLDSKTVSENPTVTVSEKPVKVSLAP